MSTHRFEAAVQSAEGSPAFIVIPAEVQAALGGRARVPVRGTLNGFAFRSSLAPYGGTFYLPVNRAMREGGDAHPGSTVVVELERDDAPRTVEVPAVLAAALDADPQARAAFERLSYSHRREYVTWIVEAKRDDTRHRRVGKAVAMLRQGRPLR